MRPIIFFSVLVVSFLITQPLQAQVKLSRKERKIIKTIERNNEEALQFLEEVVNINSGTQNLKGVKRVGMIFSKELNDIGFNANWIDMPTEMKRAGHLFAEHKGTKGKRILLIGHLDTVFEEDSPFQRFEKVNDSIAKGPGANDMKGGDIVILYALKALQQNKLLKDAQIIVALTGDEESTGKPLSISRKPLIEAAKRCDIALGFETSTGYNDATLARRGSSGWKVEVSGFRAHSSGIFNERVGAGAIFEMSRILNEFYTKVRGPEYLTFNPGIIMGGTDVTIDYNSSRGTAFGKSNVVAQKAVVKGGLRFISEEQKERARAKMREIVANNLPNTTAIIEFTDSYPAMGPTRGNEKLLKVLDGVSKDLGQGSVRAYDPGGRGAADISFVAKYVDCLDGLGTMGTGAHTPQETVNLNTVETLTKRAALLIYRLINSRN